MAHFSAYVWPSPVGKDNKIKLFNFSLIQVVHIKIGLGHFDWFGPFWPFQFLGPLGYLGRSMFWAVSGYQQSSIKC